MSAFSLERTFVPLGNGCCIGMSGGVHHYVILGAYSPWVHGTISHLWTLLQKEVGHCLEQTSTVATLTKPTICKYLVFAYGAICILLGLFYSILGM